MGFIIVVFSVVAVLAAIIGVIKACTKERLAELYLPLALSFTLGLTAHLAYNQMDELDTYKIKYTHATEKVEYLNSRVDYYQNVADSSQELAQETLTHFEAYKATADATIRQADKRNADLEANLRATKGELKVATEKLVKIQKVIETKEK
jgi:hypothetical protein